MKTYLFSSPFSSQHTRIFSPQNAWKLQVQVCTWLLVGHSQQANIELTYQQLISSFQEVMSTAEGVQFIGGR